MKMVMDGERLPSPESLKTISKGLDAEMRRLGRPDLAAQATLIDLMIAAGHISPADIDVYLQAAATRRGTQSATAADPSAQTTPDKNP